MKKRLFSLKCTTSDQALFTKAYRAERPYRSPEMRSFAFTISTVSRPNLNVSPSIAWILIQAPETLKSECLGIRVQDSADFPNRMLNIILSSVMKFYM